MISSKLCSGNCASSACTRRFAVAPVASEITCSSTTPLTRPSVPLLGRGRPGAERHGDGALVAAALDLEHKLVAGLVGIDGALDVARGLDLLAVHLDDDVVLLEVGLLTRLALAHPREADAVVALLQIDAEVGVLDLAAGLERVDDVRSEEHTSELQSRQYLVCRLLLEKKKKTKLEIYSQKKKTKKQ